MPNYRPLSNIAHDIKRDWQNVHFAAKPYLAAMFELESLSDSYMYDDGRGIVTYFLSNARQWKGDTAKLIKAELKAMLQGKPVQ